MPPAGRAVDDLFRRFLAGDEGAARRMRSRVENVAVRHPYVPPGDRDSVIDDVLFELARDASGPAYEPGDGSGRRLARITARSCLRQTRKAALEKSLGRAAGLPDRGAIDGRAWEVWTAWRSLCRWLFWLHAIEGMGWADIAELEGRGRSAEALREQMHVCLAQAASELGDSTTEDLAAPPGQTNAASHEDARVLLTEIHHGRIVEDQRHEVVAHLTACDECRRQLAAYDRLRDSLATVATPRLEPHPSVEDTLVFALRPDDFEGEVLARVAAHLRSCESCVEDIQRIRRAEGVGPEPEPRLRRWLRTPHPLVPAILAGAVAIAVLGYPAWLGLRELPEALETARALEEAKERAEARALGLESAVEQARRERDRATSWRGPGELVRLDAGATDPPRVRLRDTQPFLLVSVPVVSPPDAAGVDEIGLAVLRNDGTLVWREVFTIAEIRSGGSTNGFLTVPLPSHILSAGVHEVHVVDETAPGAEPLLRATFEIVSDGEPP